MHFKKNKLTQIIVSTCASLCTLSSVAFAQESDESTKSLKDLEVIEVTSTRLGTTLSKTSSAVTALSAKDLKTAGITDPTSLQDSTPNISIDRNNGLQITIRGISSSDNTEKGDPSASFLQDGVYIARAQAQEVSFFDLEQVEVLRGPQGTLYGRNATAGLINVMSAKPSIDYVYGSFDVSLGSFNQKQASGMINVPISDNAAIRAAVNIDKRDSYIRSGSESNAPQGPDKDNLSFRLSGLFDISDDASLLIRTDYSEIQGNERSQVLVSNFFDSNTIAAPSGDVAGTNPTYIGDQKSTDELLTVDWVDPVTASTDNKIWGIMSDFNWDLTDELALTYIGSYREFERREVNSLFFGTHPVIGPIAVPRDLTGDYSQNSHELRLTYVIDDLNLQGGLYYFSEESDIEAIFKGVLATSLPGNLGTEGYDGYVYGFPQSTTADSIAAFAQGRYSFSDTLALTLGVRQTNDEKRRVGARVLHVTVDEPLDFTASATNPLPDSLNNASVEYSEMTWKVGLDYDFSEEVLIYGHISTGYKAGGFNDGCVASDENCQSPKTEDYIYYQPEDLTAYELGIKMDLDNGLRTFFSLFHYDYENLQLNNLGLCGGAPCQNISNAGAAEIDGFEMESRYYLTDLSKVTASFTWLDATYTDYQITPNVNLSGSSLNRSPELAFTLGYERIWELESNAAITFNAVYRWNDGYDLLSNKIVAQFEQPSFSKSDISVVYTSPEEDWYVQAFVKNIEDEVTLSTADVSSNFPGLSDGVARVAAPRTMGVRFGMEF
ncbi:TonB-dependent receptor [Alteromonas sp. M12]|uniref:TonB-dependent receptor n=1 Tax=Alteromonas sp. M12 TaxID=3135644 RepID=UPI00319EBCD0